jgi:hypothetical protein
MARSEDAPIWAKTVATAPVATAEPAETLLVTPDEDTHRVACELESPRRATRVACTNSVPTTVTLAAPVAGVFDAVDVILGPGPSDVSKEANVPTRTLVVTATVELPIIPAVIVALDWIEVDDIHNDTPTALAPTRSRPLEAVDIPLLPTTVTLIAPVSGRLVGSPLETVGASYVK